MTARESSYATDNPTLTAEEVGKRFLKLLEGLGSREGLSLDRVKEVTGLTLEPSESTSLFGHSQRLSDGWFYTFTYIPDSPSTMKGIGLDFEYRGDHISDVTPVCGPDFNYYHDALVGMGFMAEQYYGEHNLFLGWRYTKFKESDGAVDMTISIVQMAGNEPGHLCVKSIGTLNGR